MGLRFTNTGPNQQQDPLEFGEKNVAVGSVSQQNQQFGQGASTSSDAPRFIEQQHYQPQLIQFGLSYEEEARRLMNMA